MTEYFVSRDAVKKHFLGITRRARSYTGTTNGCTCKEKENSMNIEKAIDLTRHHLDNAKTLQILGKDLGSRDCQDKYQQDVDFWEIVLGALLHQQDN